MNLYNGFVDASDDRICIITDYDGTLTSPEDGTSAPSFQLKRALVRTKNRAEIMLIINTGRVPSNLKSVLRDANSPPKLFNFILGNNGATSDFGNISLPSDKVKKILREFINLGGRIENIRLAGKGIYAHKNEKSEQYYAKEENVFFCSTIDDMIEQASKEGIAKLTLTADQQVLDKLGEYINKNNFECEMHIGHSKYRLPNGYIGRVDITPKGCSKGTITERVVRALKPKTFMVMGNDENDMSMFKYAIDEDAYIVLVEFEPEITKKIKKALKEYAVSQGKEWNNVHFIQIKQNEMSNLIYMIGTKSRNKKAGRGPFLKSVKFIFPQKQGKNLPKAKRKVYRGGMEK